MQVFLYVLLTCYKYVGKVILRFKSLIVGVRADRLRRVFNYERNVQKSSADISRNRFLDA